MFLHAITRQNTQTQKKKSCGICRTQSEQNPCRGWIILHNTLALHACMLLLLLNVCECVKCSSEQGKLHLQQLACTWRLS